MNLIQHFINGKVYKGSSSRKGKVEAVLTSSKNLSQDEKISINQENVLYKKEC